MKRFRLPSFFIVIVLVFLVLIAGCPTPTAGPFTAPLPSDSPDTWVAPTGKTLVWSDEFSGPGIDLSTWSYETEATGWSHTWNGGEWERYTDNGAGGPNAYIHNGLLVIRVLETACADGGYTSARLVTKGKRSWRNGVIVARMQLPCGQGLWPAFWLMGDTGSWPANGEIDVMEMIGGGTNDQRTYGTIHWADACVPPQHASAGGNYLNAAPLCSDWHYYELDKTDTTITIKFDGHPVLTKDISASECDEFRQSFYLLLNVAVGGSWPGPPNGSTVFPQYMYVDWVRVYQ